MVPYMYPYESEKLAITWGKKVFLAKSASRKPFKFREEDLAGKFELSHTPYSGARVVTDRQSDYSNPRVHVCLALNIRLPQ